jgi:tRNA G18 (ribose-2'-O)-methylase SpoU
MIERIDDPDDPRIAPFRAIRERDLVGRDGRFIAEGEVVVEVLLGQNRHRPLALLIAEARLAGLADRLARIGPEIPIYVAVQAVMDRIVGFPIHRGLIALGERAPAIPAATRLAPAGRRSRIVVLIGIANHDNVGGIFRNAAAFGADAVLIDRATCDPLYRKAIRVSVGGTLLVPFGRLDEGEDPVALVEAAGYVPLALTPAGATPLTALEPPVRAAIFLGTEGPGLPDAIMTRIRTIGIPMANGFDSLNVATTSGIVLHHLGR